jgi:hypothetical protein
LFVFNPFPGFDCIVTAPNYDVPGPDRVRVWQKGVFAEQLSEPDSSTPMSCATMVLVGADLKKVIDCCHNTLLAAGSNGMFAEPELLYMQARASLRKHRLTWKTTMPAIR